MSELSLSPNQFTELLENAQEFHAPMTETTVIKADPNSVQVDRDDDEGVLVEELTQEEEAILATLDATTGSIAAMIPEEAANLFAETETKEAATTQVVEKDMQELQIPPLNDRRLGIDPDARKMDGGDSLSPLDMVGGKTAEEVTAVTEAIMTKTQAPNNEIPSEEPVRTMDILLPVWHTFTTIISLVAFAALALGEGDTTASTIPHHPVNNFVPDTMVPNMQEIAMTSQAPPRMAMPPLAALPWFSHEENTTGLLENVNVVEEPDFTVGIEADSELEDHVWSGWSKFVCIATLVVAYYLVLLSVSSSGSRLNDIKKKVTAFLLGFDMKSIKQEYMSLNSFEDLLHFQKAFVGSGKGRRGRRGGKVDADSYLKLTRDELVLILEGFGHCPSNLVKTALIDELRSVYASALYNFSNPQILEILKAKGFSVNTPMTKQDLVSMAVKVGF
jgi:hypothetical protein